MQEESKETGKKKGKGPGRDPRMFALGLESHDESDEGVLEGQPMFQKRGNPPKFGQGMKGNKKMNLNNNDSDVIMHTESDEGINNENPNFSNNEFGPRRGQQDLDRNGGSLKKTGKGSKGPTGKAGGASGAGRQS